MCTTSAAVVDPRETLTSVSASVGAMPCCLSMATRLLATALSIGACSSGKLLRTRMIFLRVSCARLQVDVGVKTEHRTRVGHGIVASVLFEPVCVVSLFLEGSPLLCILLHLPPSSLFISHLGNDANERVFGKYEKHGTVSRRDDQMSCQASQRATGMEIRGSTHAIIIDLKHDRLAR